MLVSFESNRTIGPTFTQEWQVNPRIRIAVQLSVTHLCDQSNENEPSIPRVCHWAGTEMAVLRFQFPKWQRETLY